MSMSPEQTLQTFYTRVYNGAEKHDSPDKSRTRLVSKVAKHARNYNEDRLAVLDIGTGRQAIQKQLYSAHHLKDWYKKLHFFGIDIADISPQKLLMNCRDECEHVNASGVHIPFADDSFDLVISNHAIDFMPRAALAEARRVLSPNGIAYFNFHHPSMLSTIDRATNPLIINFWSHLIDTNGLFRSEDEIRSELSMSGLFPLSVKLETDGKDRWWETSASSLV